MKLTIVLNLGIRNGTCVLLEKLLDKKLLFLACRHHVFEVVLSGVMAIEEGPTSSPEYPIFKKFRDQWKEIDVNNFETVNLEEVDNADEILEFCQLQLNVKKCNTK